MGKKKFYLVVDTETATLPFANEICKTAAQKQKITIAKPLVYDIGWVIADRQGNIIKRENFLVQETFFVPNVFNTAYYKKKRPIYLELLEKGEIKTATWNEIMEIFLADLRTVDISAAYNAAFDFKKAIPFTERYIKHLYSEDYNDWERKQFTSAKRIVAGGKGGNNKEYLNPVFKLRGEEFPIADLWAIACERLININKYRNFCLENQLLTASAQYFNTSAETSFQYLMDQHDFTEDHTALSDALIELEILVRALKKGAVNPYMNAFPFRELGTTFAYTRDKKPKYKPVVREALKAYIEANDGVSKAYDGNKYWKRMLTTFENL